MTNTWMIVVLTSSLLGACSGSASLVRGNTVGGEVRLQGAYMPAMSEARMMMVEHCQGRFDAAERGDFVEFNCRKPRPEAVHAAQLARY